MIAILGATGRVGTTLAAELLKRGEKVRAVVRDAKKAHGLKALGAEVCIADYTDASALIAAFGGCSAVFLITPENPFAEDCIAEADAMLACYREAVITSGIKNVIGLSSGGAQHKSGTGNLTVSYNLEHLFDGLDISTAFIRPAYYFSNWMGYVDVVKSSGVLPTFFPADLKVAMIAPGDIAAFAADVITGKIEKRRVYEIYNAYYSASDIVKAMGGALGRDAEAVTIPQTEWHNTFRQIGFSESGAKNFALMTAAVIEGKTAPETEMIKLPTDFDTYIKTELLLINV